jgi:hypothetical protein
VPKRSTKTIKVKLPRVRKYIGKHTIDTSSMPGITINPNSWTNAQFTSSNTLGSGVAISGVPIVTNFNTQSKLPHLLDLRCYLFRVIIGDYDEALVTSLISSIQFDLDQAVISFYLDDKNTIRESFSEYHFFRLAYLDSKGNDVEVYEIKTDPTGVNKYILPDIRHDKTDIPLWKLVLSPYTCTKI